MNNIACKNCRHYLQHYGLDGGRLFRINCGHCTFSRAKRRKPDTKACEHFTPGTADTDEFATKEYLTKQLLQHVLNLELLPPIEESGEYSERNGRG